MMKSGAREAKSRMQNAIEQAKLCLIDVPIGCVIKKDGEVISSAHNRRELENDVTAHAELLALREVQRVLGTSRLSDCEMYVTLEPCPMCGWAIIQAGIKTLYFGAYNEQYGAFSNLKLDRIANSKIKVYGGIEEEVCSRMLGEFFKTLR